MTQCFSLSAQPSKRVAICIVTTSEVEVVRILFVCSFTNSASGAWQKTNIHYEIYIFHALCLCPLGGFSLWCVFAKGLICYPAKNYICTLENNHTGLPHLCVCMCKSHHFLLCLSVCGLKKTTLFKKWNTFNLSLTGYDISPVSWVALLHGISNGDCIYGNVCLNIPIFPCLTFESALSTGCSYLHLLSKLVGSRVWHMADMRDWKIDLLFAAQRGSAKRQEGIWSSDLFSLGRENALLSEHTETLPHLKSLKTALDEPL